LERTGNTALWLPSAPRALARGIVIALGTGRSKIGMRSQRMSETNNFALVPRAPSSLERAEPGARRILSGMVADTLALAKRERSSKRVLCVWRGEALYQAALEFLIHEQTENVMVLFFEDGAATWQALLDTPPDLLLIDEWPPVLGGDVIVGQLLDRKTRYPIFLTTSWLSDAVKRRKEFAGERPNVELLPKPDTVESLWDLTSRVLQALGRGTCGLPAFDEAASWLRGAIERDPSRAVAHYLLGEVYETAGLYEEATEKFADAEHLDLSGEITGDGPVEQLAENALQGPQAVRVLRRIVAKYPDDQHFKYTLAWAHRRENELSEAERLFREVLAHDLWCEDEWRANIELELSSVLEDEGKLEESVALVEKALPRLAGWGYWEIENNLADNYLRLGRVHDALKLVEAGLQIPKIPIPPDWSRQGIAKELADDYLRLGRFHDALKILEAAGQCWDRPRLGISNKLADDYLRLGRVQDALKLVEAALQRSGRSRREIENELADDYLRLGRVQDALKLVEAALQITARGTAMKSNQPLGRCPQCSGNVFETATGYVCDRSQADAKSCKFKINKTILQQPINRAQAAKLLIEKRTDLLMQFITKAGRPFAAFLIMDAVGRIGFEFPPRA
jgi:tetratricopeptide (TPR) repeat protein